MLPFEIPDQRRAVERRTADIRLARRHRPGQYPVRRPGDAEALRRRFPRRRRCPQSLDRVGVSHPWHQCGGDAILLPLSRKPRTLHVLASPSAGASMFDSTLWLAATILFIIALAIIVATV
jgi:hypothetical protein